MSSLLTQVNFGNEVTKFSKMDSMANILKTPGRSSLAGPVNRSPTLGEIARKFMVPDRDKAIRYAIINAFAMLLVHLFLGFLDNARVVLMPFFKPLLLALLFGSFLHPMKRSVCQFFKKILKEICDDDMPIRAGLSMPFRIIDRISAYLMRELKQQLQDLSTFKDTLAAGDFKSALYLCLSAVAISAIGGDPLIKFDIFINIIKFMIDINKSNISLSDAYLKFLIRSFILAQLCWFGLQILYIVIPVALILAFMYSARYICRILKKKLLQHLTQDRSSSPNPNLIPFNEYSIESSELSVTDAGKDDSQDPTTKDDIQHLSTQNDDIAIHHDDDDDDDLEYEDFDTTDTTTNLCDNTSYDMKISHPQLKQLYDFTGSIFKYIIECFDGSIDSISTICVIGFGALVVILTTVYLLFQIYLETIYLIEMCRQLFSSNTILKNPVLKPLFSENLLMTLQSMVEGVVKNIHEHGREWIKRTIHQLFDNPAVGDLNSTQSQALEKQILEFWDRAYAFYPNSEDNLTSIHVNMTSNITGSDIKTLSLRHKPYDWNRLFDALQSLNFSLVAQIFKQNWDTLVSVGDSLVKLLGDNLSLASGLLYAIISILLVSGTLLVNFFLDLFIFLTALYYLLCASQDQYKPIEIIKGLIPDSGLRFAMRAKGSRDNIWTSVDESVNAVFVASLKMMIFHGLSTWLLHRLFEMDVVYLPSVFSAIAGAVPLVNTYWASFPACCYLLFSGQRLQATLMFLLATVPSSYVTTAFYAEIKNIPHPFFTGLAFAGGCFVFGFQGALFGPLLLVGLQLIYSLCYRWM